MKKRFNRRSLIGGALVVIIIGGVIIGVMVHNTHKKEATPAILQDTGYSTILPDGRTIIGLGGWKRVSPAGTSAVYAYNDTLSGVSISVSEQPVPGSFKNNVGSSVAELAKSYNATATNQVGDVIVYIGTSAKGPQSVIFSKKGLLILIKSEKKIEDAAWSNYAASLN